MSKLIRSTYDLLDYEVGQAFDLVTQPSLTDPSQAMEIKDVLNMFSRGGSVRVLRAQNFGEALPAEFEAITSRINTMDKTEKAQASLDLIDTINAKTENIDKTKKAVANKKIADKAIADAKAAAEKQNPKGDV